MESMVFKTIIKNLNIGGKAVLDYDVTIQHLDEKDQVYLWAGTGTNYSVAGLEMRLQRNTIKYIIQYYIPSGLFVIVSWVMFQKSQVP